MTETRESGVKTTELLPGRLHHNAWVVADQERTRAFYEDVLGMPLVQFWIEDGPPFQGKPSVLSHAFYALADGSALAFFCMADPSVHDFFQSPKTKQFNHVALTVDRATQDHLRERLVSAGLPHFEMDHGYCKSLYTTDPDGLNLEFTLDSPQVDEINAIQARTARESLKKWLSGERKTNNAWRTH